MLWVYWLPETDDEGLKKVGAIRLPKGKKVSLSQFRLSLAHRVERLVINSDDPLESLETLINRFESSGLLGEVPRLPDAEDKEDLEDQISSLVYRIVENSPSLMDLFGRIERPKSPATKDNLTAKHLIERMDLDGYLTCLENLI